MRGSGSQGGALVLIHILDCDGWLSEVPRKRRVKEGGSLAHLPMGCERMAASVPPFPTPLASAGKMPALLEAGASRTPASRAPQNAYKDQRAALGYRLAPRWG